MIKPSVITSDPEIMGGTPVLAGMRVPFQALADDYGWKKHSFEIMKIVDGEEKELVSQAPWGDTLACA